MWLELRDGWVNVDLAATRADVCWDLRYSLPIADDTAHAVFHEFMLGYLNLKDAFTLTRECLTKGA